MARQSPGFNLQFMHDNAAAVDFLLFAYEAGTSTPKPTYKDAAGTVEHTHPIVLGEQGRIPDGMLFLEDTGAYDFELTDPDEVPVESWPGVEAIPAAASDTYLPLAGGTMEGDIELQGPATSDLHPVTLAQVQELIAAAVAAAVADFEEQVVPLGGIIEWPLETDIPGKYLRLSGQAISRETYAALFDLIGVTYGAGDGVTTFNLQDRDGVFVRQLGTDPNGNNSGRSIGSVQDFAIENITGEFNTDDRVTASGDENPFYKPAGSPDSGSDGTGSGAIIAFDASRAVSTDTETRPINQTTVWIIKALP